jgi:2-polyprenyl-3-methyl-5-hydroxy-6-metoxy-1,4-benzoquinol methylase
MNGPPDALEAQIIRSWNINAKPWARAIQAASILSRKLVTDRAIVDAVLSVSPGRVFDLGCGEGWLARALNAQGIEVTGADAVPELVAAGGIKWRTISPSRSGGWSAARSTPRSAISPYWERNP